MGYKIQRVRAIRLFIAGALCVHISIMCSYFRHATSAILDMTMMEMEVETISKRHIDDSSKTITEANQSIPRIIEEPEPNPNENIKIVEADTVTIGTNLPMIPQNRNIPASSSSGDDDDDDDDQDSEDEATSRFRLWKRRKMLPPRVIKAVLSRANDPGTCRDNTFYFPSKDGVSSLAQVAATIQRKLKTGDKKIIIAVLGDSVAEDYFGFAQALYSYLQTSNKLGFEVEVRNYAKGATGPRFTYFCNKLRGDEDLVIYENVRPFESQALMDLATSLKMSGYGVILVGWRGLPQDNANKTKLREIYGFEAAANELNLPMVNLNEDREAMRACLPTSSSRGRINEKHLFRDEIHPTPLGEVTIASMIGQTIEQAIKRFMPKDIQVNTAALAALPEKGQSEKNSVCYSRLTCSPWSVPAKGDNRCLKVTKFSGFEIRQQRRHGKIRKEWWEGRKPGDVIEMELDEPCTEILLFHNLRQTNGMVKISIDGEILDTKNQDLAPPRKQGLPSPPGVLDGWFYGFSWLPPGRGHLVEKQIAHDLEPKPHTIRLEVLNNTRSLIGLHKFDFTGIACKRG